MELKRLSTIVNSISETNPMNEHNFSDLNIFIWYLNYKNEINNTNRAFKTLLEVIQTTASGRLHALLPTHGQISDLLSKINYISSDLKQPYPTEVITEYLFNIAKTSVFKGKLHISLKIPLLNNEELDLYKIHSFS